MGDAGAYGVHKLHMRRVVHWTKWSKGKTREDKLKEYKQYFDKHKSELQAERKALKTMVWIEMYGIVANNNGPGVKDGSGVDYEAEEQIIPLK